MTQADYVVVGAGSAGCAVARRLATDGHDLVLGYAHDDEAAELTAAACRDLGVSCTTAHSATVNST